MKAKTVTLLFDVQLRYESEAGLAHLENTLKRSATIDVAGAGVREGCFSMKSVIGSEKILIKSKPNRKHERTCNRDGDECLHCGRAWRLCSVDETCRLRP